MGPSAHSAVLVDPATFRSERAMSHAEFSGIAIDSPEALARAVALVMVIDTELDPAEVAVLDTLDAFGRIGLSRSRFMQVARDFCGDLRHRMGDADWLSLADTGLIDECLRGVRSRDKRLLVARLAAGVIAADGRVRDIERMVYVHMLLRWGLSQREVSAAIRADALAA
jgi:hypothetical protein